MKKLFLIFLLLFPSLSLAEEYPTVNLPSGLRERNWLGSQGEGSCVHASMIMLFRWQGRLQLAEKWRKTYENGEYADRLASKLTKEKVWFVQTQTRDVAFLEWACSTRRGAAVSVPRDRPNHMVCLVHFDTKWAGILDNNRPGQIKWMSREAFLNWWGGWAVTPVYTPAPPLPSRG